MSEFNHLNWKEALASVYARAAIDATFRSLCSSDPIAAIEEVSDIELPSFLEVQLFENRKDFIYSFLLPPAQATGTPVDVNHLVRWAALCSDPTTSEGPP